MKLFEDLKFREIIKQMTDPRVEALINGSKLTLYCGFDPTSDSLHVGSLLPLMVLRRFQLAGHKVLCLVGGATGMIGDPSGKTQERALQSQEQIEKNVIGIKKTVSKILDLEGSNAALVVNNYDWFKEFSYIDFLRDVGKHFTVNHMMAKDSVKSRLEDREHGISYTEFSYMLLQSYDYYYLNKKYGCNLQIGGSDQWGNITAGIELIRRMFHKNDEEKDEVFGFTMPLVVKSDGTKFGKTEQGTIWIDSTKTSPYQFYQFFVQTQDSDVMTYLKYFTFLTVDELHKIEISLKNEPEKRLAQQTLARELTKMIHGEEELSKAQGATDALFGDLKNVDEASFLQMISGAPKLEKLKSDLNKLNILDLLVETKLCPSKGQARKDLLGGGLYLNNERLQDPNLILNSGSLIKEKYLLLRKGKKNYFLVEFK